MLLAPLCFASCGTVFDQCQWDCCSSTGNTPSGSFSSDTYSCSFDTDYMPYDSCVSTTCTPNYLDCNGAPYSCKSQQQSCIQKCYGSSDEYCFETCDNNAIDCMDAGGTPNPPSPGCCGGVALLLGVPFLFVAGRQFTKKVN